MVTKEIDLTQEAVERDARYWSDWADDVERGNGAGADVANMRRMMTTLRALSARLAEVEADIQRKQSDLEKAWASRDRTAEERDNAARMTMQNAIRAEALSAQLAQAVEALRPFAHATITPTGEIVGMERVFFERARATLAKIGEGHE